jgi:DNA polymerase-1
MSNIIKNLDTSQPLYCDTETNQFFSKIRLVQVFQEHWDEAQLFDIRDVNLRDVYEDMKQCTTVWHNYSYDGACFCNDLGIKENPFPFFEDTLILSKLTLYKYLESFSLDNCLEYVHGYDVYGADEIEKKTMQKSFVSTKSKDMSKMDLTEKQLQYAANDVFYLPKLFHMVKHKTEDFVYQLDKTFLRTCLVWQQNGLPVDQKRLLQFKEDTQRAIDEQTVLLPEGLNINSPKQVRIAIGSEQSDDLGLAILGAEGNEIAKAVREKRKMVKRMNFLDRYSFDRVRGFFTPTAVSGRARCQGSSVKPYDGTDNLMQIPRELKGLFGFDEKDPRYLVYADFAQLELRTVCADSGDPVLEKLFKEDNDLHIYAATQIFNKKAEDITKQERFIAKMCNFSLLYLSGWKTFKNILVKLAGSAPADREIEQTVAKWRVLYPGIKAWHKKVSSQGGGFGSKKPMFGSTLNGRNYKATKVTDLAGVQNQGLGAEVAKLAMHYFFKKEPDAKLLVFIHDSYVLEAKDLEEGKKLAHSLADSMVEAWFECTKNAKVKDLPIPTQALVGKNFGDIDGKGIYEYEYMNEGLAK